MRIPLEILQAKKVTAPNVLSLSQDQTSKTIQLLLGLDLTTFCQKLPENQLIFKQAIHVQNLYDLYNKLDQALEYFLAFTSAHQSEINQILMTFQNLLNIKANRGFFRSLDRVLQIFKSTEDLITIQYALNIVILFFKNREILQKKDYDYFEPYLPQLFNLVKTYMNHQNMNNKMEVNLCDFFRDDPGYSRYIESNHQEERNLSIPYDNRLHFECVFPSQQTQNFDENHNIIQFQEPILLQICYDNIHMFQNMNSFQISEQILYSLMEKHNISLFKNSSFYQSLQYRVKIALNLPNIHFRMQMVKTAIVALQTYGNFKILVILRKMFQSSKIRLLELIFPLVPDYLMSLKDILSLLYFELEPKFHIGILKISSMILQVDENFDFTLFMSEITTQFLFMQKIYKDCTFLAINQNTGLPECISPQILSAKIAIQHDFLNEVLVFLKKTCKNMVKEDHMHQLTNSIYQISTIMNSILKIIEISFQQTQFAFTPQNTILVLDIFSLLLPKSHSILTDFNITQKLLHFLQVHLTNLWQKKTLTTFRNEWIPITDNEIALMIGNGLKLLCQPFIRKNTSLQSLSAPTYARSIADSPIIPLCCEVLHHQEVLNSFMVLVGDVIQEVPQLVEGFIDSGVLQKIIKVLDTIPKDSEVLPNIIYFVNMYCLTERGRELEKEYQVIKMILTVLTKKDYVDILAANKTGIKNKCFDSIALELCEMINFVEYMKDPILEVIFQNSSRLHRYVKDFEQKLLKHQEIEQKFQKHIENDQKFLKNQEIDQKILNYQQIVQKSDLEQKNEQDSKKQYDQEFFSLSEHDLLYKMVMNYAKFFSKLFNQRSVIVKNLAESQAMKQYIDMITSPLIQLSDYRTLFQCNKQIAFESKYVECDLTSQVLDSLKSQLEELELCISLKEQTSLNVNLNYLMTVKKGQLKLLVEDPKPEWKLPIKISQILGSLDLILDFLCMVKFPKDHVLVLKMLEKFSHLYIILIKQNHLEEMYVQDKKIEIEIKKCNLLVNLRKFFLNSIKSIPDQKNDISIISSYATLISKLLLKLEPNCSKLNYKYIDHAYDLLMSYNEVFKRSNKMNPWIPILLHSSGGLDAFFKYTIFFVKEFDEQKGVFLPNISNLFKHILFISVDNSVTIDINGSPTTGVQLDTYIYSLYLHQLQNFELVLQEMLSLETFEFKPQKVFFDMIFEKMKKFNQLITVEESKKTGQTQIQIIIQQLLDMGFSQTQAETATREIEYPDVNLAAEWLFSHPDLPQLPKIAQKSSQIFLKALSKEEFQSSSLTILNNLGRLFIYQLFYLPLEQCAEFVLDLINFQPNPDTKKVLFSELSYIVFSCVKQVTRQKKYKFKVHSKGRQEAAQLMKEHKLIRCEIEEIQDSSRPKSGEDAQRVIKLNILLEFFLRISTLVDIEVKSSVVNAKLANELIRLNDTISTSEEVIYQNYFLFNLRMLHEVLASKDSIEETSKSILDFILNQLPRLATINILNANSLEGLIQILIMIINNNPENNTNFMNKKGLQLLLQVNFLIQVQSTVSFSGLLNTFCQFIHILIEDEDLVSYTIEHEIKQLLSHNKNILEFESFIRYFKKYSKTPQFLIITDKICSVSMQNKQKMIKLKDKLQVTPKYQPKNSTTLIAQLLVEHCQTSLLNSLEDKPVNSFNYNVILKTIHVIVRQFPSLTTIFLKQNCSKFFKKPNGINSTHFLPSTLIVSSNNLAIPNVNSSQISSSQTNFLTFLIKGVSFLSMDRLRPLIYELCLDNHFNQGAVTRQKVINELFEILQNELKSPDLFKTNQSVHTISVFCSLHVFLLSLKEMVKLSLKEDPNFFLLYSNLLQSLSIKNYYQQEDLHRFIIEPLSLLFQYGNCQNFKNGNSNWLLSQLMPTRLLLKKSTFVDDWNGTIKPEIFEGAMIDHDDSQDEDDDPDVLEEMIIEDEGNGHPDLYGNVQMDIQDQEEDSQESEESDDDQEQDDDDMDEEEMDIEDEDEGHQECDHDDEDDDSQEDEEDGQTDSESSEQMEIEFEEGEEDDGQDEGFDHDSQDNNDISEESRAQAINFNKFTKIDQDLGQIVNLGFLNSIDNEHIKINLNFINYFQLHYHDEPFKDEFFKGIIKIYKYIQENTTVILAKGSENQWIKFETNKPKPQAYSSIWHVGFQQQGHLLQEQASEEESNLDVNPNQFVISSLDRQDDLPFHITQALQSAFRGQSFRTIFADNSNILRPDRSLMNQTQQRQREQDELNQFRSLLLNQMALETVVEQPNEIHVERQIDVSLQNQIQPQIEQQIQSQVQQQMQPQISQQIDQVIEEIIHEANQQQVQNQQNQNMDIEPKPFSFSELGLPADFLEQHQIDRELFFSLSDDLKMEILMDYMPQPSQAAQDNDNLEFLNSLPPNLREEVLLTYPDEILEQLPQSIQQEAQQIRQHGIRNIGFYEQNIFAPRFLKEKKKKPKMERKQSSLNDHMVKILTVDDLFIEKLIELLFVDDFSFSKFPFELFKTLVTIPSNEFRILDAVIFLLRRDVKPVNGFPLSSILMREIIQDEPEEVFEQISLRIFYLLTKCCSGNSISYFLENIEGKLSIAKIEQMKQQSISSIKQSTPFMFLNDLLSEKIVYSNIEHLDYLVSLLNLIVQKSIEQKEKSFKFQMEQDRVKTLCNILIKSDDQINRKLSSLILVFCNDRENLHLFIQELKTTIVNLSIQINKTIEKNLKELQIRQNMMEIEQSSISDTLLIAKIESEFEQEIQIQKIFKLIKQLLENCSSEQKDSSEIRASFQSLIIGDQLNSLWINVSEFLVSLYESFNKSLNVINPLIHRLTPILECFFIIYKIVIDEHQNKEKTKTEIEIQEIKEDIVVPIIDRTFSQLRNEKLEFEDFFIVISEKNRKFINLMVKQNVHVLNDSLSLIIKKVPHLLDFENKKLYFKSLKVRRNDIFKDSYSQLSPRQANELFGKLHIEFSGEEGMDAGGVSREWFLLLSKEIFNPNYALFLPSANGNTFQPSPHSKINPDHLSFFKFVGRFIAKALHDGYMLDAYFTRAFYKHILGQPLSIIDMEDIDPQYYKNLKWILENDITLFDLTFSYEADDFGYVVTKELLPNGRNIAVTNANKKDYVRLICQVKMGKDIEAQLKAFLEGFHELIPNAIISIFSSKELELMISGLPDIDHLKNNTEYNGYSQNSQIIRYLWDILDNFDKQEKAAFIQFVTGTSKVPLEGFKALVGMGGQIQKFTVHKAFDTNKLPTSHTCFNQLDLPEYSSKELLKEKLLLAISEGKEGFGFV